MGIDVVGMDKNVQRTFAEFVVACERLDYRVELVRIVKPAKTDVGTLWGIPFEVTG